ncbi:MAG: T9SS type A sorting domain-containing protein, partial [Bacteroidota bacterium]
ANANTQAMYDSLMAFDVLFIRGGDQWLYYQDWGGTLTEQAIKDQFNAGGTIMGTSAGMAILSSPWYTAENGTVYPDEMLTDANNSFATMQTDFLGLVPDFLFDSHFVERGRLGRLAGLITRYNHENNDDIIGLGVDDKTAICIDTTFRSYVHGTGSVTCIGAGWSWEGLSGSKYVLGDGGMPLTNLPTGTRYVQAIDGDTIFLTTGQFFATEPEKVRYSNGFGHPPVFEDQGGIVNPQNGNLPAAWFPAINILLSGSNPVDENTDLLDRLVDRFNALPPNIISEGVEILTGSDTTLASAYKQELEGRGVSNVKIYALSDPTVVTNPITNTNTLPYNTTVLVVEPSLEVLQAIRTKSYSTEGLFSPPQFTTGHIRSSLYTVAYIGTAASYVGKYYNTNPTVSDGAAFNGELEFEEGLNLIPWSIVQTGTYADSTDYYENNISAVPYAMAKYDLARGFWINPGSYLEFRSSNPQSPEGQPVELVSGGSMANMYLEARPDGEQQITALNPPTFFEIYADTTQVPRALGADGPRQMGSTSAYRLHLLGEESSPLEVGLFEEIYIVRTHLKEDNAANPLLAYPNPVQHTLTLELPDEQAHTRPSVSVSDLNGRRLTTRVQQDGQRLQLDLSAPPAGVYIVQVAGYQPLRVVKID